MKRKTKSLSAKKMFSVGDIKEINKTPETILLKPPVKPKQPWEMTREEYVKKKLGKSLKEIENELENLKKDIPYFDVHRSYKRQVAKLNKNQKLLLKQYQNKNNKLQTILREHIESIAIAIAEGKDVPDKIKETIMGQGRSPFKIREIDKNIPLEDAKRLARILNEAVRETFKQALKENKTLPPEVLKDYPDLIKEYRKNTILNQIIKEAASIAEIKRKIKEESLKGKFEYPKELDKENTGSYQDLEDYKIMLRKDYDKEALKADAEKGYLPAVFAAKHKKIDFIEPSHTYTLKQMINKMINE